MSGRGSHLIARALSSMAATSHASRLASRLCSLLASSSTPSSSTITTMHHHHHHHQPKSFASSALPTAPPGYTPVTIGSLQPRAKRQLVKRVGRGPGSGSRLAGRGFKGQKARNSIHPLFEGGNTRFADLIPRVGFSNPTKLMLKECALGRVVEAVKRGTIDPNQLITMKVMRDAGLVQRQIRDGVKLLVMGHELVDLDRLPPLHFEVTRCTASAREAIEAAGGSVTIVYYAKLALFAMLEPERWWRVGKPLPRSARPKPRHAHKWEAIGAVPAPTEIPDERKRPFTRPIPGLAAANNNNARIV